ncbi:MAG TPA: hypothetical protein VGB85_05390 [Nannocystis sp.]|jgi:hypothetical protein
MLIRRSLGACVLLLLACGPKDEGSDDGSSDSSDTTAGSTMGGSTSPTTSGDTTGECGPVPTPTACTPDESSDSRIAVCAERDEAGCPGPIDQAGAECVWIATASFAHDTTTCEAPKPGGACVAVEYYGDGCAGAACGSEDIPGDIFYRTNAACQTEVTLDAFCGYSVIGWNACAWENRATDSCALPHPTKGPEPCNCAC